MNHELLRWIRHCRYKVINLIFSHFQTMNFYFLRFLFVISISCKIFGQANDKAICDVCNCSEQEINCRNLKLNQSFPSEAWRNVTNSQFSEAYFDSNYIGHVTAFPSLSLVKLSYKNNRLIKIDDRAFKALTKLEELDLSMNELTSINLLPAVFEVKKKKKRKKKEINKFFFRCRRLEEVAGIYNSYLREGHVSF